MKRHVFFSFTFASLTLLAACGGGGGGDDDGFIDNNAEFISFRNNANDQVIKDASNDSFKVLARNGCLYWVDRDVQIVNWCRTGNGAQMNFASHLIMVSPALSANNTCIMVLVEQASNQTIDVVLSADNVARFIRSGRNATPC